MLLSQHELIDILSNLSWIQTNEWATLFLRKKNELMLRNILTIVLENYCRDKQPKSETMALHEYQKHDVAIVTRTKPKRAYRYVPNTLIELKFENAFWVTVNEGATEYIGIDSHLQDNIWRGNYQLRKPAGDETGIKYDLLKLIKKQSSTESPIAIHHVVCLVNPHQEIDEKYRPIIDALDQKNNCIKEHGHHQRVLEHSVEILKKQLKVIEASYLNNRKFKLNSTSIPIGTAFGTEVDLGFLVISESNN